MRPCRATASGAPSRLVASPRRHCSWSRPNIPNCVSLGHAMGLWVIAVGIRPTSHNCISTRSQSGVALDLCDRPTFAHTVTRHSRTTSHKKKHDFNVPRHVMRKNPVRRFRTVAHRGAPELTQKAPTSARPGSRTRRSTSGRTPNFSTTSGFRSDRIPTQRWTH